MDAYSRYVCVCVWEGVGGGQQQTKTKNLNQTKQYNTKQTKNPQKTNININLNFFLIEGTLLLLLCFRLLSWCLKCSILGVATVVIEPVILPSKVSPQKEKKKMLMQIIVFAVDELRHLPL